MEFELFEILDGFELPLRCNLKLFELVLIEFEPFEVVETDLKFR